jgi:hypothetical protein
VADPDTIDDSRSLDAVARHLDTGIALLGPVLRCTFPASGTKLDVAHRLPVIPDGYLIVLADAEVHAMPGVVWTTSLAYLVANANNAHALVRFYTLREAVLNA